MKKFTNHVDHAVWLSRLENLDRNVADLERVSGVQLTRFERKDIGLVICLSWESGLEVLAPMTEKSVFNQALHDRLDSHGEGFLGIVFGVRDLDRHAKRLAALGMELGPEADDHPDSPWHHQLLLRERTAPMFMNSWFVLGDIDYADGVIPFGDA